MSRGNRACTILGYFCLNRSYRRSLRDSRALWFPFWYKLRSTYFPSKEIYICIRFNFKQVVYNCSFFFTILKYYLEYKLTQLYEASRKRCMTIHVTFSERDWFYVAWWPKIAYCKTLYMLRLPFCSLSCHVSWPLCDIGRKGYEEG